MSKFFKFIIAVVGCEIIGLLSTPFTTGAITTWYPTLTKPFLNPPNWIFTPVWTTLYFLMGVSLYLVWSMKEQESQKDLKELGIKVFLVQLGLNFLWSAIFFGMQNPLLAAIEIAFLLAAIFYTILVFKKISKTAAYLLIPYLLWVAFASYLNIAILILNF